MKTPRLARGLFGLLLLPAAACGPQDNAFLAGRTLPIINGAPDLAPGHDAIVAVLSRTPDGQGMCTGSLIGRRVVLTAAHCVDESVADDITIEFGQNRYTPTASRQVEAMAVHPAYNWPAYDFALLRFTNEPPADIVPIPALPAHLAITSADEGQPLELVGYGETETGSTGERLTITLPIDEVCTSPSGCDVEIGGYLVDVPPHTICYDQATGGVCFGDSGGPDLFDRGGREYVVGVHAMVAGDHCDVYGCSIKADALWSFIEGFARPVGETCNGGNDCMSGHCADGVCCSTRCAGVCERCDAPGSVGTCTPLADGTSCADESVCNGVETCQAGLCEPGTAMTCDDGVDCTEDSCDPGAGCRHQPKVALCDDHSDCTNDSCDPAAGCVFDPLPDGYGCGADACRMCSAGRCVEAPDCGGGGGCGTALPGADPHPPGWLLLLALLLLFLRGVPRHG